MLLPIVLMNEHLLESHFIKFFLGTISMRAMANQYGAISNHAVIGLHYVLVFQSERQEAAKQTNLRKQNSCKTALIFVTF